LIPRGIYSQTQYSYKEPGFPNKDCEQRQYTKSIRKRPGKRKKKPEERKIKQSKRSITERKEVKDKRLKLRD
jgi:hypothetical protein